MAVAFDAVGPSASGAGNSGTSPLTWTHTCGAGATALYVAICVGHLTSSFADSTATVTATYNGITMTALSAGQSGTVASGLDSNATNSNGFVKVFKLASPPTGSAYTVSVTVTASGAMSSLAGGSISVTGSGGEGALASLGSVSTANTSGSVNVTGTTAGGLVLAFIGTGSGGETATGGTTQRYKDDVNTSSGAGGASAETLASPGGTAAMSWTMTSDSYCVIAFESQPPAVTAPVPTPVLTPPPGLSPLRLFRAVQVPGPVIPLVTVSNTFDNGTQAAAITTASSAGGGTAFDNYGGSPVFDNTHLRGSSVMSALLTHTASTLSAPFVSWQTAVGMLGTVWFRFYLFATANPTVNARIWQCHSAAISSGLCAAVSMLTTGQIRVAGQSSTFTTSTASIPLNAWTRLEGYVTAGATTGQTELRLFTSNPENPVSAYDEIDTSPPGQAAGTNLPDRYVFGDYSGTTQTATWQLWYDDVGVSGQGYLGPTGVVATPVTQADVAAAAESPFSITVTVPWADAAGAADAETVAAAVPLADAAGAADAVVPAAAVPVADAAGAADAVSVTGLPLDNSAEGGTNGVNVTQGNSGGSSGAAWDNVGNTNGTAQYSTARAMHGTTSYYFATSATAGVGYVGWSPTSVKTPTQVAGGRAYVNFTGNPAAPDANIQIKGTGSSTAGNIQVDTSGHIVAQTPGFANAFTFTNALSLNTWYRIEWAMTCGAAGSASMAVSLFAGDSTTAIETRTDTANAWGGTGGVAECDFGWTNSHANQPGLYMDDMDLNAVGMPGPSTGPTPVSQGDVAAAVDAMVPAAAVPLPETAGAAETLSVSATAALGDTAAVTDQLTVSAAVSLPDAAASADAIAPPAAAVPLTERGAAAESQVIGIPQSDVSGAADAISVSVAASLPDTAGAAESQAIGLPQADAAGAAEQVAVTASLADADAAGAADQVAVAAAASLAEAAGAAESVSVAITNPTTEADAAGAADALTVTAAVPVAEVAAAADTLAVTAAASLAETAGAADALTVSGTSNPALPDVAGGADTVTVAAAVTMPDSGSGVDAVAATVTASLTDTAAASDAISRVVGTNPADAAGAADALTVTASVSLPEQAAGSDVFSVAGSAAPALPDLGAATDQISTAASTAAADAAAGADQLTAAVAVSLPELAGAAETLTVAVSVSVPDAGAASDTLTSGEGALLADFAAAADALHVAVTTALADAGAAPDQLAISATATLADVASAVDASVTQTVIFKTGTVEWAARPEAARWHTEPLTGRWLVKASAPRWQAEPVEGRWSTQPELARWRVSMDDFEAVSALSPEMVNIRWTSDLDGTTIDPTSQPLVVQFAMPVSSGNVFAPAQPAQWYPASWLTGGKGKGFVQQCPVGPLTTGPTLTAGVKYDVWAKIVGGTPESPVKFAGVLSVY